MLPKTFEILKSIEEFLFSPKALFSRVYVALREQLFGDSIDSLSRGKKASRIDEPASNVPGNHGALSAKSSTTDRN